MFGEFVSAGIHPVAVIAMESDVATIETCAQYDIPIALADEHILHSAGCTVTTPGPVAIIEIPEPPELRCRNTLVLVAISDPGNVGTMIRTACAFGWDVAYTPATADPWAPKTLRSGVGTHVTTRLVPLHDGLERITNVGLAPLATVVQGGASAVPGRDPVALMVGSEAHGLPDWALVEQVTQVSIDMPGGTESLNAAIAAGILMYELT